MTDTQIPREQRVDGSPARAPTTASLVGPVLGVVVLVSTAFAVPELTGWAVHPIGVAPLSASWQPRLGSGTAPAVLLGIAAIGWGPRVVERLRWSLLLAVVWAYGVVWAAALAFVDGSGGIGHVLERRGEYLRTARTVHDVPTLLHEFVSRIPVHSPDAWTTHVAGHPPGALLFFVLLVRLGLGSGTAAGWTVVAIGATTAPAVLITLRRLGALPSARAVAPLLVVGPAAIWMAVSADAVFGATVAWAVCALAVAATTTHRLPAGAIALGAGVLFGCCVLLSYGLPLAGVLGGAVLVLARTARPAVPAVLGAAAVVLTFAACGFRWWSAYPVLRTRYYDGIAAVRPASYWVWGDLAALCLSAGPVVGVAVALAVRGVRTRRRDVVVVLPLAALGCVLAADLSSMSKGEVERIWLPFVPWLLVGAAALPPHRRRVAIGLQVLAALAVQTLFHSRW